MNQNQDSVTEPKLAPPGAGIPLPARLILRFIVLPLMSRKMNLESSFELFRKEGARILQMTERRSANELEKKILVPPQRGLEDSSRYWSAHMTIEHLMIVGRAIAEVIVDLSHERKHAVVADIAKVKPLGERNSAQIRSEYENFMKELEPSIRSRLGNIHSSTTHVHPWFGPMTAQQWLWLLGVHQGIHRKQIKEILLRV